VNTTTAVVTFLGQTTIKPASFVRISRVPTAPFLYVLGFTNSGQEFIWTYKLNAAGVPVGKPIQTLSVKPALTQFVMHPNGKFAYAMFSWVAIDPNTGKNGFFADIILFTIDPKTGLLTNTKKVVVNTAVNDSYQTSVLELNAKGTEIYTEMVPTTSSGPTSGPVYYLHGSVSALNGTVSTPMVFWGDPTGDGTSGIGDLFIARSEPDSGFSGHPVINVYTNTNNPTLAVHCDISMLAVCADNISHLLFDPTGKYLLFNHTVFTTTDVPILYVNASSKQLVASGATIPGSPYITRFSPSGILLYAAEDSGIFVYVFNPHTGLLTAKSTIGLNSVQQLLPIK
jgi:hypothetical protein